MGDSEIQNVKNRLGIIGINSALNRNIEIAIQVARTDLSVLVTGESGSGKEFFPQIIHLFSSRKHGPYFAVNCGAIPEGTIDSELFGHEKGAFTDAKAERKGYFEIADGGTLFLDEVGELPISTQVRLLRVLESGEYIRMGASKVLKTNVRVVAATNLDMRNAIQQGKFREDLYFRLNTVEIKVPPLRERKEDIPLLFKKFAFDFAEKYHVPPVQLTQEAVHMLQTYYWYGNIRQLKNVAEQISILEPDKAITPQILERYIPSNERESTLALSPPRADSDKGSFLSERELLYKILFDMRNDINHLKEQFYAANNVIGETLITPPLKSSIEDTNGPSVTSDSPLLKNNPGNDYQIAEEVNEDIETLEELEKNAIKKALDKFKGNRKKVAQILKISERTLYRKLREYDL